MEALRGDGADLSDALLTRERAVLLVVVRRASMLRASNELRATSVELEVRLRAGRSLT